MIDWDATFCKNDLKNTYLQCINCGIEFPCYKIKIDKPCPSCKMTGEEYNWIRNGIGYGQLE